MAPHVRDRSRGQTIPPTIDGRPFPESISVSPRLHFPARPAVPVRLFYGFLMEEGASRIQAGRARPLHVLVLGDDRRLVLRVVNTRRDGRGAGSAAGVEGPGWSSGGGHEHKDLRSRPWPGTPELTRDVSHDPGKEDSGPFRDARRERDTDNGSPRCSARPSQTVV